MKKIFIVLIIVIILLSGCSVAKNNNSTGQKVFTLDELKKYDGTNGNPAYVAVEGIVYDVTDSRLWKSGLHDQCSNSTYAGADYTDLIKNSPHGATIMKQMPVVGTLQQ